MTTARRLILILAGVALLVIFISRFVLIELLARRVGLELIAAIVEAVAITGFGWLAIRGASFLLHLRATADVKSVDVSSAASTAFLVGYPLLGTLCFLIGTIHISAATMFIPFLIGLGGALFAARALAPASSRPALLDAAAKTALEESATTRFALFAISLVIVCGFIVSQAPPVSLDELAYHLAIPHTWVLEGRVIDLPLLSHSYFPLGIESADLPLFTLFARTAGTASHFLHVIAALAVVLILLRRASTSGRSGALIVAAIVTVPALAVTTGWSLVDWPLVGVFLIGAAAVEDGDDALLAAALAAGLLTKYTFVPFAVLLIAISRRWRPAIIGAAAGSIFFVRNLLLTGNPLAPFFSANAPHVSGFRAADIAAYIFDGRFVDESLGASLLMLVPAAAGVLAWSALAMAGLLFFLASSSRILLPFLAVGGVSTLKHDGDPSSGMTPARRIVHLLLIAAIAAQLLLVVWFTWRDDSFSLVAGRVSDEEYVAARRASYPMIAWLNSLLPASSRTIVVGLNETYWFEHPVRGGGNFDGPRMSAYLTDGDLRAKLQRDGITHVAVFVQTPPTTEGRKRAERETALSADAQRALAAVLQSSAARVSGPNGVQLFALR